MSESTQKRIPKNPIRFNISLNSEQKEAKSLILQNKITVLKGSAGSGKANWINTPVLTPDGYKLMGDIKKGDYVISEEGLPIKVLGVFPQGVKPIHKITFSDGSTTECTLDHLWNVISRGNLHRKFNRNGKRNKKYKEYETYTLQEIINKGLKKRKRDEWFIPLCSPVNFNKQDVLIDPYILGCLLGDGCFRSMLSITSQDNEIIEYFKNNLDMDIHPTSKKGSISYYITKFERNNKPNPLVEILKKYNLWGKNSFDKFIPKEYLYNSIDVRLSLLQGLLDTDGWCQFSKFRTGKGKSSNVYVSTVSHQLKEDIVYLVNSLGGVCYYQKKQGKYKAKNEKEYKHTAINYRILIRFNNHNIEKQLFRLKRKQDRVILSKNIVNKSISKVEFMCEDNAQCIMVDSPTHLYLTNNSIVTHNTLVAAQVALDLLFRKEIEKIVLTRPVVTAGEEIGFLKGELNEKMSPFSAPIYDNMHRLYNKEKIDKEISEGHIEVIPLAFMRGRNLTNCCVVLDEAQNVTHRQMELLLGRICSGTKLIICGDQAQIDLKDRKQSGFKFICDNFVNVNGFGVVSLKTNHRDPIVEEIIKIYDNYRD